MTPRQRKLARHALGLPNAARRSYRNHYVAAYAAGPYDDWAAMVDAGEAGAAPAIRNGRQRFWLTEKGARAALDPGETLCHEDFPE
jgi:hypothetical protein